MPLDEFGREIPPPSGGPSHNNTPPTHRPPPPPPPPPRSKPPKGPQHPSHKYVEEPLLCEYVYKSNNSHTESYDEYRKSYCLNYIRKFFNYHLDDSWFRNLCSPVAKVQLRTAELARAKREAQTVREKLQTDDFRIHVKLNHVDVPKSHLFSFQTDQSYYLIDKIPTHVTESQLLRSLSEQEDVELYNITGLRPYRTRQMLLVCKPSIRKLEEIVVDASDPYQRNHYDVDGRGSAPTDSRVFVTRTDTLKLKGVEPRTAELSLALSHPDRIGDDLARARELCHLLDRQRDVEAFAVPDDWGATDQLDTYVSYLRRVHLWNFYNASQFHSVGDMVLAPIFYRRQNITEPLDTDDLLLKRLEENIGKAIADVRDQPFIDTHLQQQADEIRAAEEATKLTWMENHGIIDNDNRARCSFHFCHKLFKDTTFLHKHLIKKHSMFQLAEQAKAHDPYMMEYWDAADKRPVPNILVDCGVILGLKEIAISHGPVPDCVDPEPDLWRQYREKHAPKRRLEEDRPVRPRPNSTFVDVDDMKEEKVEVKFDNIIPDPAVIKKKKKKRKLL